MAVEYIGNGNPDGSSFGSAITEKVSFYGVTPVIQPTSGSQAAVATSTITTAATSTSPYGYATTTQADAIPAQIVALRTLVNQMRTDLVNLGLLKGS